MSACLAPCRKLLDELVALGEPEALVMRALCALDSQGEFQLRRERSVVYRVR
jgi:DNA replication licensing factor MCM5